jgi:class 3 adenylate cyclase
VQDEQSSGPPLPDDPQLREIAVAMEDTGVSGEILDADWKVVFMSSEEARIVGVAPKDVDRFYGKSLIARNLEDADFFGITDESSRNWWRRNVPIMRHYFSPGEPGFEETFGELSEPAARAEPVDLPPRAWGSSYAFLPDLQLRRSVLGDVTFLDVRINDDDGRFLGVIRFARTALPESLMARLSRGDPGLYERMDNVREPARRTASILFADLEASGVLSRRLSSRGYFELIGGLTDLIDSSVISRRGIVGKHAGDGGSALFLALDFDASESAAARAAVEAAYAIRDGAAELGPDDLSVKVNLGLHWGGTLMVGQVATSGRLEVTALGDPMNETARIEAAAREGAILASKELIERLEPDDASAIGIDPDAIDYVPLGELEGAGAKAVRDAAGIPVAEI